MQAWRRMARLLLRPKFWLWAVAVCCLLVMLLYGWVSWRSSNNIYTDVQALPATHTLLLLGTSKRLSDGDPNPFFHNRMQAAAMLYKSGKVQRLILSGEHSSNYYNEPKDMRQALLALGVPAEAIYMDYAGLRTFDSVLRARAVFGATQVVIVSQRFHIERALFIAQAKGIAAIGFAAPDPEPWWFGLRVQARELLARVNVVLDLYILDTQPQYPGPS